VVARFVDNLPIAIDVFLIALGLMMWKRAAQSSSEKGEERREKREGMLAPGNP